MIQDITSSYFLNGEFFTTENISTGDVITPYPGIYSGVEAIPIDVLCTDNNGVYCTEYQIHGYKYDTTQIFGQLYDIKLIMFAILMVLSLLVGFVIFRSFIFKRGE